MVSSSVPVRLERRVRLGVSSPNGSELDVGEVALRCPAAPAPDGREVLMGASDLEPSRDAMRSSGVSDGDISFPDAPFPLLIGNGAARAAARRRRRTRQKKKPTPTTTSVTTTERAQAIAVLALPDIPPGTGWVPLPSSGTTVAVDVLQWCQLRISENVCGAYRPKGLAATK